MTERLQHLRTLFEKICHDDDEAAFAELFRMEYKRLYSFSLQYVGRHESAEEVVNDVFVKLWKYRNSIASINNPESYLFIAVKNQSLNHIKKYSHLHISIGEDGKTAALVSASSIQSDMEWKELQHKLQQVIDQLPDQCRKIYKLVKEEGIKTKQVARILNISSRTVETQLYRAAKRLLQLLEKELPKQNKQKGKLISLLPWMGIFLLFT
jgi:RNA polymerase sigma-70 factor (family 1)